VIVNDLTVEQAIGACYLQGTVPLSTVYSPVHARRDSGFYDVLVRKSDEEKMQMVIDITGAYDDDEGDRNISPITMNSITTPEIVHVINYLHVKRFFSYVHLTFLYVHVP
jgi:hypothetical protein